MYFVEGKERFSNLMWCQLSHQICANHEPSVMNANGSVLFLTWNPVLQWLQFVIRVYRTNTLSTTISWIFFAVSFLLLQFLSILCSVVPPISNLICNVIAIPLLSVYETMIVWYENSFSFHLLFFVLFRLSERRLGNAVDLFATALT